jgi:hypothetical protein
MVFNTEWQMKTEAIGGPEAGEMLIETKFSFH